MPQRLLRLDRGDQLGDDLGQVADDRHVGLPVLADLGRVDVGVDDRCLRGERRELAGDAIVEPRTEGDEQVRLLQGADSGHGAVHPGHAQVLRVAVRERAAGHEGGRHRDTGDVRQATQRLGRACPDHPAAHVEHRPLRRHDHAGRLPDLLGVRARDRVVAGQVELGRPGELRQALQRILGDVDEDRAGTAGRGQVEGLRDGARDLVGIGHEEVVLGDRHGDAADVSLLEGVGPDRPTRHLTGDRDHGHRVHVGVRDRRDKVRRTGAAGGQAHADPSGRGRVALCRVPGTLLVPHEDVAYLDRIHEGVVGRQDRPARNAEDGAGLCGFQRKHQALRSGDLLAHLFPSLDSCNEKPPDPIRVAEGARG